MVLVSGTTDRYVSPEALRNEQARLTGVGLAATSRSFTGGTRSIAAPWLRLRRLFAAEAAHVSPHLPVGPLMA